MKTREELLEADLYLASCSAEAGKHHGQRQDKNHREEVALRAFIRALGYSQEETRAIYTTAIKRLS